MRHQSSGRPSCMVKVEILPVGIDHDVKVFISKFRPSQESRRETASPVKDPPPLLFPVPPLDIFTPVATPPDGWMGLSEHDQCLSSEKAQHFPIVLEKVPIQPGDFIVLVIRVVVPFLGAHEFVASAEHRGPLASISRQKKFFTCRLRSAMTSEETFESPSQPQFQLRLSLVPSVLLWPFASLCFSLCADQVVKAETVVRSDEINALVYGRVHFHRTIRKKVVAAVQAPHQGTDHSSVSFDEGADVVAEFPVPLPPHRTRKASSEQVAADIPGFCNKSHVAHVSEQTNFTYQRRILHIDGAVERAGKYRCQIEPESVYMHVLRRLMRLDRINNLTTEWAQFIV